MVVAVVLGINPGLLVASVRSGGAWSFFHISMPVSSEAILEAQLQFYRGGGYDRDLPTIVKIQAQSYQMN